MLIKVTVESNQKKSLDVGTKALKTEFVHGARTVQTSKTEFTYPTNPRDRRSSSTKIVTTEGIAAFKTAFAATWNANYIDLPVFPDNNSANSTVTRTFSIDDLVYFEPDPASPTTRSFGYINEGGFKVVKYLIDYDIDQIIDIADTGATTTTTTTTTTA